MKKIIATIVSILPAIASAQAITDVNSLTYKLTNLGNTFIGILIAFAVIWIIWKSVMFIVKADDEAEREKNRSGILWGIVGLAVILSIWGLVAILTNTFKTNNTAPVNQYPQVQYPPQVP